MKNLELNKILGAFLFVGFIILLSSNLVDIIYSSINDVEKRGYNIEVESSDENSSSSSSSSSENTNIFPSWNIPELLKNASAENGEKIAKKCTSCHTFKAGEPNRVGPNLHNIVGRTKASVEGFNYSKAMKDKGGVWDEQSLLEYIYNPKKSIPGNRMAFAGIKKEAELADLLSFLSKT